MSDKANNSQRFLELVLMGDDAACWEFQGTRDKDGYGLFGRGGDRWPRRAHRRMWLMATGEPIPEGKWVLHHCDNPPCVNPAHLYLGTHRDNMDDRVERDRGVRGERVNTAKLTMAQALQVKGLTEQGWVQEDIADAYGVSQKIVSQIKCGEVWKRDLEVAA